MTLERTQNLRTSTVDPVPLRHGPLGLVTWWAIGACSTTAAPTLVHALGRAGIVCAIAGAAAGAKVKTRSGIEERLRLATMLQANAPHGGRWRART